MRILILLCALALTVASPAGAQSSQSVDPAAVAQARAYLEKTGMTGIMRLMINNSTLGVRRLLEMSNPGKGEAIAEVMIVMVEEFDQRLPLMIEAVALIYAQHFTAEELTAITAFYDTPAGRKLVKELPTIVKEGQAIGEAIGRRIGLDVLNKLAPELKRRELKLEPSKT